MTLPTAAATQAIGLQSDPYRPPPAHASLYARTCDPTLDLLKAAGAMTDAEIVEQMVSACFDGLGC